MSQSWWVLLRAATMLVEYGRVVILIDIQGAEAVFKTQDFTLTHVNLSLKLQILYTQSYFVLVDFPHMLNCSSIWRWLFSFKFQLLYPKGKLAWYTRDRKLRSPPDVLVNTDLPTSMDIERGPWVPRRRIEVLVMTITSTERPIHAHCRLLSWVKGPRVSSYPLCKA